MNALRNLKSKARSCSGQALVEFMFVTIMLMVLFFGLIDFCRVISTKQVLVNISREGSNLASRGSGTNVEGIISTAIGTVISNAAPLNMTANGQVIITAVLNSNGTFLVIDQVSEGNLTQASKVAPGGIGSKPNSPPMPVQATVAGTIPQPNQTMYITEVFYSFSPVTPIGRLLGITMPSTLYDVAYF